VIRTPSWRRRNLELVTVDVTDDAVEGFDRPEEFDESLPPPLLGSAEPQADCEPDIEDVDRVDDVVEVDLDDEEEGGAVARRSPARSPASRSPRVVTSTAGKAGPGKPAAGAGAAAAPRPEVPKPLLPLYVTGTALAIVAAMLLAFAADVLVIGHIRHSRDQQTAFDDLRADLDTVTAPVNQTDDDGRLLPLGTALGVIEIPQIGLREVYFEGTTSAVMQSGPGHRRDTAMPGQAGASVIMGRKAAFGGPFNQLGELRPGMAFWAWTGQGQVAYRVTGVRRTTDAAPAAVAAGQGRLTLVTATGDDYLPDDVLRVDAALVTAVQASGPRPVTALDLPPSELAMHGEPGAWLDVLIRALLLFVLALAATGAQLRWGRWQTWIAAGPALLALGISLAEQMVRLLPNLM
jgi:sortase A